ncbi:MAG: cache domain-containing protein [Elusimicrobia bacterium]|nr:cache domain-containing protein [Elusimicrobiota bacterium]
MMMRNLWFMLAVPMFVANSVAWAGQYGSAAEAKSMLRRAAAAVKKDKAKALAMFTKGDGGFKVRDLYPFCGGPDGMFTAHPTLMGKSMRDLSDQTGNPFGKEMYGVAKEGGFAQVSYQWARPDETQPSAKKAYVTKVGDQVCAVGYYCPEFGSAAEAKIMLERAVAELKLDKAKALAMFTKGESGFKDRDLYPYCGGPDGMYTAHPKLMGKSLRDQKDSDGKATGNAMYEVAKEGEFAHFSYRWPRPNETKPSAKGAYVTKVGDQVCAVGYYKP